jgi:hypothetical protein
MALLFLNLSMNILMNKKYESPTKAIRNLGNMLNMKLIALNKISGKLIINRFKIPNYAYSKRCASL